MRRVFDIHLGNLLVLAFIKHSPISAVRHDYFQNTNCIRWACKPLMAKLSEKLYKENMRELSCA